MVIHKLYFSTKGSFCTRLKNKITKQELGGVTMIVKEK